MQWQSDQPPFDPDKPVEWAEVRGNFVHVSQGGYSYKSGPYSNEDDAEIASFRLKFHLGGKHARECSA